MSRWLQVMRCGLMAGALSVAMAQTPGSNPNDTNPSGTAMPNTSGTAPGTTANPGDLTGNYNGNPNYPGYTGHTSNFGWLGLAGLLGLLGLRPGRDRGIDVRDRTVDMRDT